MQTTTSCYYATIHTASSILLAEICRDQGALAPFPINDDGAFLCSCSQDRERSLGNAAWTVIRHKTTARPPSHPWNPRRPSWRISTALPTTRSGLVLSNRSLRPALLYPALPNYCPLYQPSLSLALRPSPSKLTCRRTCASWRR